MAATMTATAMWIFGTAFPDVLASTANLLKANGWRPARRSASAPRISRPLASRTGRWCTAKPWFSLPSGLRNRNLGLNRRSRRNGRGDYADGGLEAENAPPCVAPSLRRRFSQLVRASLPNDACFDVELIPTAALDHIELLNNAPMVFAPYRLAALGAFSYMPVRC